MTRVADSFCPELPDGAAKALMKRKSTWNLAYLPPAFLLLAMTLLAARTPAFSQTGQGAVVGALIDPTGAVVVGAVVTLTNIESGIARKTTSNDEGLYRFNGIEPGAYSLNISAQDLDELTEGNILVTAGQTPVIDKQLKWNTRPVVVSIKVGGGPLPPTPEPSAKAQPVGVSNQSAAPPIRHHRPRHLSHKRHHHRHNRRQR